MPRLVVRFLMQYGTVVQLACQTHQAQPLGIYVMQMPSLKVLSSCTVELQPSSLMLAILLRAAFCFKLHLATANFRRTTNWRLPARIGVIRARSRVSFPKGIHYSKLKYMIYGILSPTHGVTGVYGSPASRTRKSRRLFPEGPITIAAARLERKE